MPSSATLVLAAFAAAALGSATDPSPKWCRRDPVPLCDDAAATGSGHRRSLRVSSYPTNKGHFCFAAHAWLGSERGARWDGAAFFEGRPRCPSDTACGGGDATREAVAVFFQDEHALVRPGANFSCGTTCVSAVGSAKGALDAKGRPYTVRVVQGGKYDVYDVIADYR